MLMASRSPPQPAPGVYVLDGDNVDDPFVAHHHSAVYGLLQPRSATTDYDAGVGRTLLICQRPDNAGWNCLKVENTLLNRHAYASSIARQPQSYRIYTAKRLLFLMT
jgi:hypothetical protein